MSKTATKAFYLRGVDGKRVEVPEKIYRAWHREDRRERYLEERDQAHGKVSLSQYDTYGIPLEGYIYRERDLVENIVLRNIYLDLLSKYVDILPAEQKQVIKLLFDDGLSITKAAEHMGWSRKKVRSRRDKALKTLNHLFEQDGITDYQI